MVLWTFRILRLERRHRDIGQERGLRGNGRIVLFVAPRIARSSFMWDCTASRAESDSDLHTKALQNELGGFNTSGLVIHVRVELRSLLSQYLHCIHSLESYILE